MSAWNICPVCKQHVDIPDDVHDGSYVKCIPCKEYLVIVECKGDAWELQAVDDHDPPDGLPLHPLDPPRSQALEEQPPFTPEESKRFLGQMRMLSPRAEAAPATYPAAVHRLAAVYVDATEKPIKPGQVSHYNGLAAVRDAVAAELAEAEAETSITAPDLVERLVEVVRRSERECPSWDWKVQTEASIRAVIAAMGGEATTDLQAAEDALHRIVGTVSAIEKHNSHPKAMDDIRSEANGLIRFVEKSLLTIAAKDATIAEQAMEIGRLKADARIFELAGPAALYATTKLTGSVARAGDAMRAGRVILTGKALGVWEGYVLEYVTNLDKP